MKDTQLLPQQQDLNILVMVRPAPQPDEVKQQRQRLRENDEQHVDERARIMPGGEIASKKELLRHADKALESIRPIFRTLRVQLVEDLEFDLDGLTESREQRKLVKAVREFASYINANRAFIPNYGERYRYGEAISTAFVESTVNQVISKRMVKKQQMRWTRRGAHNLLQIRTRVLDGEFGQSFARWYPGMQPAEHEVALAA